VVVDFEGEPLRALEERRLKESPLRDVAGMWRSWAYAGVVGGGAREAVCRMQESFLEGWQESMDLPGGDWRGFLEGLIWEKAIYEVLYEIQQRPHWLEVPLAAL
jgi:predicted trehalose synthase